MNRSMLVIMSLFVLTGGIIVSAAAITGGAANGKVAGSDLKVCECPKGAL